MALILTSMIVAILSGMPLNEITDSLVSGMGSALGMLATIVGLGAIFGQVLEYSRRCPKFGEWSSQNVRAKNGAPMAMVLVGFLISIPVFFDVALVILAPILVAMARKSGKSILRYGLPLCAGNGCYARLYSANSGADFGRLEFGS